MQEGIPRAILKDRRDKGKIAKNYAVIKAPEIFSLTDNPNGLIDFVNHCERARNNRSKTGVAFDLRLVKELDFSGIGVLISLVYKLKLHKVKFNGINPTKRELCLLLEHYNFFEQIGITPSYDNINFNVGKKGDKITIKGDKIVKPELGIEIANYISEKLFNDTLHTNDGFYRLFLELMANTTTWSQQENDKNLWLLIMSYDKDERNINFQFIDFGIGIFGSLRKSKKHSKWFGAISNLITSDAQILQSMLEGKSKVYKSSTGLYYRGKGIPTIKKGYDGNFYKNVEILTNKVYVNLDKDQFITLDNNFNGTLIRFTVSADNHFFKFVEQL